MDSDKNSQQDQEEIIALMNRLEETEETLRAIRQYMVDAFVVSDENRQQVVTLADAEYPYRKMVEAMNEGAVTLIPDGTIFYCNPCFAHLLEMEEKPLIGMRFHDLVVPEQRNQWEQDFRQASHQSTRAEFMLLGSQGRHVPVQLSMYALGGPTNGVSVLATDITERVEAAEKIRSLASDLTIAEHEERHRISQILHDDLQQHLFAITAQLSFLQLSDDPTKVQDTLDQVQRSLTDAISLTRNLSIDISPAVLHGEGLTQAILWLCTRMREQYGLECKVSVIDALDHPDEHMRILLFQIVQELLFNIVKHAETSQATVVLEHVDGRGRITIGDSGKGFDMDMLKTEPASAHGLLFLQDRMRLMRGRLTVDSRPGDGARVVIEFPIEENTI